MCIGLYTLSHPDYALILCSNRDEFFHRPAADAHFHSFETLTGSASPTSAEGRVCSGRDLAAGGTWIGASKTGRIALLTNITEERATYTTSRGELASAYLLSATPLKDYAEQLTAPENWKSYAGFNMLLLAPIPTEAGQNVSYGGVYITNSGGGGPITGRPLSDSERVYGGISNGVDSQGGVDWPKLVEGRAALSTALAELRDTGEDDPEAIVARLASILRLRSNEPIKKREDLRKTILIQPLPIPTDKAGLKPILYGTRTATFILVKRSGEISFFERSIAPESHAQSSGATLDRRFKWQIAEEAL